MSQEIQGRKSGWPRTIYGVGYADESTPSGDSSEPKFVAIGARVGRSGQVFETNGRADRVVKLFTWAAGLPEQAVQDFTRDVIRVADLHHPNVAQVFDAGVLADGTPFVVMERLAGMTLDEAAGGRSFPVAEVLPVLRGVGSALSAAHAAGIAHGQFRAENVFIADPVRHGPAYPKLLDFGVARLVAGAREPGRGADAFGHRAAERADQLALAALAWRLLGPTSAPAIERVLLRAMNPDPSQRFGSVAGLVEALEAATTRAAPGRLEASAAAARTLAVASVPVSPGRRAVAVVAPPAAPAPPRVSTPATAARPPASAPPPVPASPPSSLTQQFFADGERLDIEHATRGTGAATAVAEEEESDEESAVETAAAARVPRSRAQMAAAAALALGSVALIVWTVVSLASKPDGGLGAAAPPPAAAVVRPAAVSPAKPLRPAAPTSRGPAGKTLQSRGAPPVQPPPFAAPTRPSVTTPDAPAAAGAPAPARLDVPPIPAPRPWGEPLSAPSDGTPVPAAASPGESAPSAAPVERNDEETQSGEDTGDEPLGAEPPSGTPGETTAAPRPSDDVSPAPSVTEAPAPTALVQPAGP